MNTKGRNLSDVQNMNRSLIIRIIQKKHRTTRAEISKETGLNKATVTNIVSNLISWGVIKEVGLISGEAGRRSIAIELAADDYAIIGLWVTRRHLHVGIYNMYGKSSSVQSYLIGLNSQAEELINTICEKVTEIKETCTEKKILGVALALPGPYIKEEERIALLTERSDWQNVDIVSRIRERIDMEIITEHDTYASAVAEWCFTQNYDETSSMFCITVSLGVGGCYVENGRIMSGNLGVAGEIGHMSIDYRGIPCECGNRGCLEKYCTTIAVLKKAKRLLPDYPDTCCSENMIESELLDAYRKGDPLACKVINEAGKYLGYGIANIINICNPKTIIIGDEIARAGEPFLKVVKESARERVLPIIFNETEIQLSNLHDSILSGVCMSFMQRVVEKPELFFKTKLN